MAQATETKHITLNDIMAVLSVMSERLEKIESNATGATRSRQSQREMTDDDARQVLTDLAGLKHNEAADKLGLSYGQVYSCRLGYTFKNVRQDLQKSGVKNNWLEKSHAD